MANVQDLFSYRFNRFGQTFINSTTEYSGKWFAIEIVAAAKFDSETTYETSFVPSLDGDAFKNATSGSAYEFPAGTILYGDFTKIKLLSGVVLSYKNNTATAATT